MRTLFLASPILLLAFACQAREPDTDACQAGLASLNVSEIEEVLIVRDVSGHDGYGLIARDCDYIVPFSISPMRESDRVSLNRDVRELVRKDGRSTGVGFFVAQCACTFDPATGVVGASAVTDLRPYTGPALIGP